MTTEQKYFLSPRNYDEDMNCPVRLTCCDAEARKVALRMAGELQSALLLRGNVKVGIQSERDAFRGKCKIYAT